MHCIPVNTNIVTMTSWLPDLSDNSGPRYVAIAEALARDVAEGRLAPGDRLPTHRDLAWRLGVTVGTVSRAYAEAERRGLTTGTVGRGTFVCEPMLTPLPAETRDGTGLIDLAHNFPPLLRAVPALSQAIGEVAQSPALADLMGYRFEAGQRAHRAAIARWCTEQGVPATADISALSANARSMAWATSSGMTGFCRKSIACRRRAATALSNDALPVITIAVSGRCLRR